MGTIAKTIKIIRTPHGEHPAWVRNGWVGCVLPCEPECGHVDTYAEGLLSGKISKFGGFSVPQDKALEILMQRSEVAAQWFKDHGYPRKGQCFRFMRSEVEVVEYLTAEEERKLGPMHVHDDMETGTMRRMF